MRADLDDGDAILAQWYQQGAWAMDPTRFARIQSLQRRLIHYRGPVQEQLRQRVQAMIRAYAARLQDWQAPTPASRPGATVAPSLLAELVAQLKRQPSDSGQDPPLHTPAGQGYAGTDALAQSRQVWSRLRTQSQLRATLEQLPVDAGPLNSAVLAHRALGLMLEVAPGYLEHYVAYVDTLASLELLSATTTAAGPNGSSPASAAGKRVVRKPRKKKLASP